MQITVTTEDGGIYPLDVSGDLVLRDLKALLEAETGLGTSQMLLIHNMAPMVDDKKNLRAYGVDDGDIIMVSAYTGPVTTSHGGNPLFDYRSGVQGSSGFAPQAQGGVTLPAIDWSRVDLAQQVPIQRQPQQYRDPEDPEAIRQHLLSNPSELTLLQDRNPALAEALLSGDPQRWREALENHQRAVGEVEMQRIRMLNADPFDPDVQRRIAQEIEQRNIQENMEAALEHTPESFARVVMLYISCKVNGVAVKALVDSGARSTVMSARCAERCGIMRLVDRRFHGVAIGVGTQKIVGRVHLGQIQIGNDFLTSSFQVLEEQAEDMLFGLDMLKKHQCCIDLQKGVLRVGTTGNETAFLTEMDLQEKEEMERRQASLHMEDEDSKMAKAVAKSEEEYEDKIKTQSQQGIGSSHQSTSTASAAGLSPSHAQQEFPEADIQRITSVGFSREEAIQELRSCHGNVEMALTSLVGKSFKV